MNNENELWTSTVKKMAATIDQTLIELSSILGQAANGWGLWCLRSPLLYGKAWMGTRPLWWEISQSS